MPTESGADMLLEKNGVFAEATLKKVDLWWKWHFSFHLKSEEESKTFGLKAKQVGWSKANAACRSIKEESLKVKGHIYISREASRQVPYQNAITMVVTKFTPKKKKKIKDNVTVWIQIISASTFFELRFSLFFFFFWFSRNS